jgi:hypothetical protein
VPWLACGCCLQGGEGAGDGRRAKGHAGRARLGACLGTRRAGAEGAYKGSIDLDISVRRVCRSCRSNFLPQLSSPQSTCHPLGDAAEPLCNVSMSPPSTMHFEARMSGGVWVSLHSSCCYCLPSSPCSLPRPCPPPAPPLYRQSRVEYTFPTDQIILPPATLSPANWSKPFAAIPCLGCAVLDAGSYWEFAVSASRESGDHCLISSCYS